MLPCYDAMRYLENKGQTFIAISINRRSKAVIGLIDKALDEASSVINVLIREMGIKVYMLTGNNAQTATFVANEIGFLLTMLLVTYSHKFVTLEQSISDYED